MLLTQQPWVRFPAFASFFWGKIKDIAEVNQRRRSEAQWLENVDLTHLVLASGKPAGVIYWHK